LLEGMEGYSQTVVYAAIVDPAGGAGVTAARRPR